MRQATPTLVDLLRGRALRQPDRRAYTFLLDGETGEVDHTYEALDRRARAIAAALQRMGAGGERALLLYPPGLEYLEAFFGCLYAGAVAVPAYPPNPARMERTLPRLRAVASDSRPLVGLTTAALLPAVTALSAQNPAFAGVRWLATDIIAGDAATEWRAPALGGDSLALLQYTSGSTTAPRGVMLTHANLLHNSGLIERAFAHTTESRGVIWLPPYHDMGLIGGVIQPLYAGFPVVLLSPVAFLQRPLRWLEAITRYRATTSGGPNFAYDLCVRKSTPEQRAALDLSSWRVAFNGAEPVRAATLERFAQAFAPCGFRREAFYPCYGLAEATLIVSGGAAGAAPVVRAFDGAALARNEALEAPAEGQALVGCGRALPGLQIAVVDPQTTVACAPGRVGEVWLAGPSVAPGYWERPDETERLFRARQADTGSGPFLRTGDLGFVSEGELYITGRLKDLIIIRGRNHYPQDIELTVERSHAALRPGCGAAFTVEAGGAERLVVVQEVDRQERAPDLEALARAIRGAVAEQHELQVATVALLKAGSIPKTSSGKIQRHACRAAFLAGELEVIGSSTLDGDAAGEEREPVTRTALLALTPAERRPLLESYLLERAARLLNVAPSRLEREQPLIVLGLDSLMAIELANAIEADLGMAVPAVELLADFSIAQLAAQAGEQLAAGDTRAAPLARAHEIGPIGHIQYAPTTDDQQRLWLLDQLTPGNSAYNIPAALRLSGALDVAALQRALDEVVRRHEALRTTFAVVDGQQVQVVAPALAVPLPIIDLRGLPEPSRAGEAQRRATAEAQRPFDLAHGPLVRAVLLRLADAEHVAVFTTHHIISDLWSMGILVDEIAALYEAFSAGRPAPLPELPIQYADFARWLQGPGLRGQGSGVRRQGDKQTRRQGDKEPGASDSPTPDTQHPTPDTQHPTPNTQHPTPNTQYPTPDTQHPQLAYWRERLAGAAALDLPSDRPRPAVQSFRGRQLRFELPPRLVEALRELGRREGATLFMTLLAAFKTVLARYSGRHDILVGFPIRGRTRPETEALIGFFAYPLVLRSDLAGDPTFRELLARVRTAALEAYANRDVPFSKVVAAARAERATNRSPLVQVMFSLVKAPIKRVALPGLTIEPLEIESGTTDFDLFLTMVEDGAGLRGSLAYNADLFDGETIAQLAHAYCDVLEQCTRLPETRLAQLRLPEALAARAAAARERERKQLIAVAATFTAEPIAESLAFWMRELELPSEIVFAPYNQVFQQLLDPASLLAQNRRGVNIVLVRFEDWLRFEGAAGADTAAGSLELVERNVRDLAAALKSAAQAGATPYVVCLCPPSPRAGARHAPFFEELEELLATELAATGVYTITTAQLNAAYPVAVAYDPHGDQLGHIPFTPACFTALGTIIARTIYALQSAPRKVIALDCDQVLWGGVCGEDGALGVVLDPARRALQAFMLAQRDAGMLLCVCSKNNGEDVAAVFERRPEMPLKREQIAAWRTNWRPKSENLHALAAELGLGLDSFIFIDDDPLECAEVEAHCPGVLALQLPQEPQGIARFLAHVWAFDHPKLTADDRRRADRYRQESDRERLRSESPTFEAFLAGLGLEVRIAELAPQQLARAAQLTQRTNQFNVTTIRRSEGELQALCRAGTYECLVVEAADRFGDYGMVGVIVFGVDAGALAVDTFLLSCRALGRGVEHAMLARLGTMALERGIERVEVPYRPSEKNRPALAFLERAGARSARRTGDGLLFSFPADVAAGLVYRPAGAPSGKTRGEPDDDSITSGVPAPSARLQRIAAELYDAEQILRAMRAVRQARPDLDAGFVAPRTPTEEQLARIWAELLGLERVGIHHNFFELGGHSLLAAQLITQVRAVFQVELPLKALFSDTPTIAELAGVIEYQQIAQAEEAELDAALREMDELSDEEIRALISDIDA